MNRHTATTANVANLLNQVSFFLVSVTVLGSPWLFGAWERWWFWPFAALISLSSGCFGSRLLIHACGEASLTIPFREDDSGSSPRPHLRLLLSTIPFLLYALIRTTLSDVAMDAERAFLLFLTPILIGVQVIYGLTRKQQRTLLAFILIDLVLLGIYGLVNHHVTGSHLVLWAEGYPDYTRDSRATGSYFCPDHFAGIMEFAFALAAAYAISRQTRWSSKWGYIGVILMATLCVILSKSRGGGLTIVVMTAATAWWGFSQWPTEQAIWHRVSAIAVLAIGLILIWNLDISYTTRFKAYFATPSTGQEQTLREKAGQLRYRLDRTTRGRMINGALRAWRSAPVFGIGAGMHRNLWPDFAPTADGDREQGIRPTLLNNHFHSYEVHSDWVQLLEEYGVVGFVLFLIGAGSVFGTLVRGNRRECDRWRRHRERQPGKSDHAVILGGLLVFVSMAFHSLGDFNLQMPATTWMFAAILSIALAAALDRPTSLRRTRE